MKTIERLVALALALVLPVAVAQAGTKAWTDYQHDAWPYAGGGAYAYYVNADDDGMVSVEDVASPASWDIVILAENPPSLSCWAIFVVDFGDGGRAADTLVRRGGSPYCARYQVLDQIAAWPNYWGIYGLFPS